MAQSGSPPLPEKEVLNPMPPIVNECYTEAAKKYKGKTKKKIEQLLRTLNELWHDGFYRPDAERYIADIKEALNEPAILQKTIANIRRQIKERFIQ